MTPLPEIPNLYALAVPEGATDIRLHKVQGIQEWCITCFIPDLGTETQYLPASPQVKGWQLIAPKVVSDFSEDEAKGVVEDKKHEDQIFYQDYEQPPCYFDTAIESLQSLMKKHNLNHKQIILLSQK